MLYGYVNAFDSLMGNGYDGGVGFHAVNIGFLYLEELYKWCRIQLSRWYDRSGIVCKLGALNYYFCFFSEVHTRL
jgi:hypothetical protein